MKAIILLLLILSLTGCITLNVPINTSVGDHSKPAIKTDAQADQNISPSTTVKIPLK